MSNLQKVAEFMTAAGQTINEKPSQISSKDAILRVRLILEEAFELAQAAGVKITLKNDYELEDRAITDSDLSYSQEGEQDLVEVADALADIEYVMHGASLSWGLPAQEVFDEVQDSNMSKFIDGHRDAGGKWIKGPSYRPTNIKPIIDAKL